MTREDINDIINAICPNDEDYEKPCISPKYLRQELEQLALDQRQWNGEPTTKNDLPHCQHTDAEITKSFIEDVETVKEHLPCGEQMDFPNTFDEFAEDYGFRDKKEIYTNGSELIPVFRVKQWLEHISTTKNDLGVDCVSRKQALRELKESAEHHANNSRETVLLRRDRDIIRALPSVTPKIEPRKGHWTCDRANVRCSCCGRGYKDFYGKARIASYNYCPNCGSYNGGASNGNE